MQVKKMNLFTRIKKSIINFEDYEKFLEEPIKNAFKYFFKLIMIFSFFVTIALTYTVNSSITSIKAAIQTTLPDFKVENSVLNIEEHQEYEQYLEDYDFYLIMNENEEEYETSNYGNCLIMLKDKMIIKYGGYVDEIGYNNLGDFSNQTLIDFFATREWKITYISICVAMFAANFISYSLIILLDVVTLSILGLIINTFIRTKFKYQDIMKISVYAMTLPILLYLIYIIANTIFGITIKYFSIAYSAISYIYIVTVMLMIKSDIIKNTQELQKVIEEQEKVKEDLEREKQEERERQKRKEREEKEKNKEKKDKEGKKPQEPQPNNG